MKNKILLILPLMLALMVACEDDDNGNGNNGEQPANEVWMSDSAFMPSELTVSAGTTVRWVNNSNVTHTVTSTDGLFDETLAVDGVFSFTFSEPGTYDYTCTIHVGMNGTVIVE